MIEHLFIANLSKGVSMGFLPFCCITNKCTITLMSCMAVTFCLEAIVFHEVASYTISSWRASFQEPVYVKATGSTVTP